MSLNRGQTAVRMIKALATARGDIPGAIAYAQGQRWADVREVVESIQMAAVTSTGTNDIALPTPAAFDFAEFIRPQTIIGKLVGLRRVPLRVRVIAATAGSTAYWAGERSPTPISRITLTGNTLEQLSVISMVVTTLELIRSSSPSAESILSRDLANAIVTAMDSAFIDHSNAGSAGIKPAAITYGATALHSAGTSLANMDSDRAALTQALSDAGSDLTYATWVMRPRTWLAMKRARGTGGALAYPGLTTVRAGGELDGLPVVVSASVPLDDIGSPVTGFTEIVLLDPSQILVADEGNSSLMVSTQGALLMDDAPGGGAQSLVSLWQTGAAALRLARFVNWQRCRAGMAQILDRVTY